MTRLLVVIVLCTVFVSVSQQKQLKVTLFYETLCPDCKEMILDQLYPAYEKIGNYLTMDLVPYGFATSKFINGKWEFDCQHGPIECYRNKLDACAMDQTTNQSNIMKFVYCLEAQDRNAVVTEIIRCAESAQLYWNIMENCANGDRGSQLLLKYEKRMREAKPQVKYVPTVFFNDYFNSTLEKKAESNFLKTACALLEFEPDICKNNVNEQSYETFIV